VDVQRTHLAIGGGGSGRPLPLGVGLPIHFIFRCVVEQRFGWEVNQLVLEWLFVRRRKRHVLDFKNVNILILLCYGGTGLDRRLVYNIELVLPLDISAASPITAPDDW
jgi:hypothetical protein